MISHGKGKALARILHHERDGGYMTQKVGRRFKGLENEPFLKVEPDDVLAVLGDNPESGIVYGVLAEPLIKSEKVPDWGRLHWFREVEDDDVYVLKEGMQIAFDILKECNLHRTLPIDIEVRCPRGQFAGVYYFNPKSSDSMELRPKEFESPDEIAAMLVHEMGHSVWFRLLNSSVQAKWIGLYTSTMKMYRTNMKSIKDMFYFLVQDGSVAACRRNLPADELDLFNACIDYLRRLKGLDTRNVNTLIKTDKKSLEKLKLLWPRTSLDVLSTANEDDGITDYAKKSVEEFFAETFRVRLTHGKGHLPGKVDRYLTKSINIASMN